MNPHPPAIPTPINRMSKPIGKRELRKHLQGLTPEQLVNHLLHLGESFKDVQAYLQNVAQTRCWRPAPRSGTTGGAAFPPRARGGSPRGARC